MRSSWSHRQGAGGHQPDGTANPQGLIPFRQTLLTGFIYLSQNLFGRKKKKEEGFIANIHTGRINGGEQPSFYHCSKYVRPACFPLLPSCILPGFP